MIQKTILDNGIRVVSERMPHAHSVAIGIWVANGSRHESPEYNGVAHFIEHLLFKGTARRSALDIAREIDSIGGVLNAFTSREYVCYYAKVLHKYLPKAVDLLTDIFLNSCFDSDEIEKERNVVLQEICMQEDNPDDFIHDLFSRNFWRGHPLGMPIIGNEETIARLSRDYIVSYKSDMYRAEDIIIAVAGNFDHKELLGLLNGSFAEIPEGRGHEYCSLPVYEKRVEAIERDLEQIHVCLGTKALPQNHPHRFDVYMLNTILGGGMSSRLFQEIREKRALAYSIYSYILSHSDAGALVVYVGASPERLGEVVETSLGEISRMKNEPVSTVELEASREQLKGNILLSLESTDNRMSKLAKNEIYFGRYLPITEILEGFDKVTLESLSGVAHDLFDEQYLTMTILGRLGDSQLDDKLLKL